MKVTIKVWLLALASLALASAVHAINLNEDFTEPEFPPVGWQTVETGDGDSLWQRTTLNNLSAPAATRVRAEDVGGGNVAIRWLITPKLNVVALDSIKFNSRTTFDFDSDLDSLYILVSTSDSLTSSFSDTLDVLTCGDFDIDNVYAEFTYSLSAYIGQQIFIAFQSRDSDDGGLNDLYLDDISGPEVLVAPDYATGPSPLNNAVGVDPSTNLDWTNGSGTSTVDLYLALSQDSVDNNEPAARKITNTLATSYNPPSDLEEGETYYWKVVTRNTYGETHGHVWLFTVMNVPLAGVYDIGGATPDFASFTEAVAALYGNGISDDVTFEVYGTDYAERIVLTGSIVGAGPNDRITFHDASGTARILDSTASASSTPVVDFNGVDYVTWDGIDIWATVETDVCLTLHGGSTDNIIQNATFTTSGQIPETSVARTIRMFSANNDNNLFTDLVLSGSGTGSTASTAFGVQLSGTSSGNIFENNTVINARACIDLQQQNNCHIRNNDLQPGYAGQTFPAWGIDLGTFDAGDTLDIYGNICHNFSSSSSSGSGLYSSGTNNGLVRIYNNFVYDFSGLTGAAQARGIDLSSGVYEIYNNSIRLDMGSATGRVMAMRLNSSTASAVQTIYNNIFYSTLSSDTAIGISVTSAGGIPDLCDNNLYGSVANATWFPMWMSTTANLQYATVQEIRDSTTLEDHGISGNPGFLSATNLHIDPTIGVVSNGGYPTFVSVDIDGDARPETPDIGADEYFYTNAPAVDYRVLEIMDVVALYPEFTPTTVRARVQNIGSTAPANVPVRLFYNGAQQDEVLLSLAIEDLDTVTLDWTPPAAPSVGNLEVQTFAAGDAVLANDSLISASVTVVQPPLNGDYDIGGGANHYATIALAVTALTLRGVDGAVTFHVYAATYAPVTIPEIVGASASNTITFIEAGALATPPEISGAAPVVNLNGADYITFDGIDFIATTGNNTFQITNDANNNAVRNAVITGSSVASSTTVGVYILGGSNDDNLVEDVSITGCGTGLRASGTSTVPDLNTEFRNADIPECRNGIHFEYQRGGRAHDNDIQPGWTGVANFEVAGILVGSHAAGDTSYSYNNMIHNLRSGTGTSAHLNGVRASVGTTAGSYHVSYNNFIYGFTAGTSTSQVYGLRLVTGSAAFYNNSVWINDVTSTGAVHGMHLAGAGIGIFRNNVVRNDELTNASWALNRSAAGVTADATYNAAYGTGAAYNAVNNNGTTIATLAAFDANSVDGDPGFVDGANLHIQPTFNLLNGEGIVVSGITTDIDGDTRGTPPDIGADEYEFSVLADDYGVIGFVDIQPTYLTEDPTQISVDIQNYGTAAHTNVSVKLYYNDVEQDELLVSLTAGERDTIVFDWTPPATDIVENGTLEAQSFLAGDDYPDNDSALTAVTTVGAPLCGTYDIGGGNNDFANFTDAVAALSIVGIECETVFDVYAGTYNEAITITEVNGANFTDRVIFQNHNADVVTLTNNAALRLVTLDGADYITFDGVDMTGLEATDSVVVVKNGAIGTTIKNLSITGSDSTITGNRGIKVYFNANHDGVVDNVKIRGCGRSFTFETGTGQSDNWEIMNCDISGGSYGIYLDDCHNVRVHDNDIQPHGYASTDGWGVYVASLTAGDTVYVYNNRIHNFRHTSLTDFADVGGVTAAASNATALAVIFNNFIYDFQSNGPNAIGINTSTGSSLIAFNSIVMNDVGIEEATKIACIYQSSGTHAYVNNIFATTEPSDSCYGIWRASGTIASSDYNAFYGISPEFRTGRDGTNHYPTLNDWQTGTGRDLNAVEGEPGFTSATDLHILSSYNLVNGAGIAVPGISDDIDGDLRNDPPDIGADEYEAVPDSVTDLVIIPDTDNGNVILTWTATTGAQSYHIFINDSSDFPATPEYQLDQIEGTTYTHVGVLNSFEKRFYRVTADSDPVPEAVISRPARPSQR